MKYLIIPLLIFGLVFSLIPAQAKAASVNDEMIRIEKASTVLEEIMAIPDNSIPANLLADAKGIAIYPNVVKAAFAVGARFGQGVFVAREPDGSWSSPSFINLVGGSFGFQIGAEVTDLVLVFMTQRSVEALGKGDLTLGATASIAAGPIGRSGEASTDIKLSAEILSYSKTRGLFGGVALDGAIVQVDTDANRLVYGTPDPIKIAATKVPALARRFTCIVAKYTGTSDKMCA